MSHPVRLARLEALSSGPLTATEAGELIGETPTTCSFHLRQLAKFAAGEALQIAQNLQVVMAGRLVVGAGLPSLVGVLDYRFVPAIAGCSVWPARCSCSHPAYVPRAGPGRSETG